MRQLDYQARVLDTLDAYLETLAREKTRADEIARLAAEKPDLGIPVPDFTLETWEKMRKDGLLPPSRADVPFSKRRDGTGSPAPNVVMKVPPAAARPFSPSTPSRG